MPVPSLPDFPPNSYRIFFVIKASVFRASLKNRRKIYRGTTGISNRIYQIFYPQRHFNISHYRETPRQLPAGVYWPSVLCAELHLTADRAEHVPEFPERERDMLLCLARLFIFRQADFPADLRIQVAIEKRLYFSVSFAFKAHDAPRIFRMPEFQTFPALICGVDAERIACALQQRFQHRRKKRSDIADPVFQVMQPGFHLAPLKLARTSTVSDVLFLHAFPVLSNSVRITVLHLIHFFAQQLREIVPENLRKIVCQQIVIH